MIKTTPTKTGVIEFIEESHQYLIDGIPVPSATTIVSWLVGKDYSAVPDDILNAKADYGNRIHQWVEDYLMHGTEGEQTKTMELSTKQVKKLIADAGFKAWASEIAVKYKNHFAGTYDILGIIDKDVTLVDIKTTAELDKEYLSWQLGLYKVAILEGGAVSDIQRCMCLWIPKKGLAQLVEIIPKTEDEVMEGIAKYEEEHHANRKEVLPDWF